MCVRAESAMATATFTRSIARCDTGAARRTEQGFAR
jgi:hypothetical protein